MGSKTEYSVNIAFCSFAAAIIHFVYQFLSCPNVSDKMVAIAIMNIVVSIQFVIYFRARSNLETMRAPNRSSPLAIHDRLQFKRLH